MVIHDEDKESKCPLALDNGVNNSEVSDHSSKRRKSYIINKNQSNEIVNCGVISNVREINEQDIDKLRRVYRKCKVVMRQIESKYGPLLDLQDDIVSSLGQNENKNGIKQCNCALNKKIIFNDDGTQLCRESPLENHVCPEKEILHDSRDKITLGKSDVQIEYDNNEIQLPEDLPSLVNILQNTEIDVTYRNKVINKMKSVKQEHVSDIKFNRRSLIDEIKEHPNEVFHFEGSNLSTIRGYL